MIIVIQLVHMCTCCNVYLYVLLPEVRILKVVILEQVWIFGPGPFEFPLQRGVKGCRRLNPSSNSFLKCNDLILY